MIEKYNIPLDEYPRRCVEQIKGWEKEREDILKDGKVTQKDPKNMLLISWKQLPQAIHIRSVAMC